MKSFVKDVIDKLPTIQARENNFGKLISNLTKQGLKATGEERTTLNNKVKIIEMLRNEEQRSAIQELVKNGTIQTFSEDNMSRLLNKGLSTHLDDQGALEELMNDFQSAIMFIGSDIEDVEKKVNEKVEAMKPSSELGIPSPERASGEGIIGSSGLS
ncbi:hypothetical protein [Wolbachia endosymbiont of Nilaparvata lugens]|uniref:hypothetical protein n=1 Tax=Wolbachia endosymbiont of Nilaparvata lugens TaxID=357143 RepID=UPI00117D2E4B|nr:hypothetical protein [Wolbachia endosymbiont of Nilaparvata lugens]